MSRVLSIAWGGLRRVGVEDTLTSLIEELGGIDVVKKFRPGIGGLASIVDSELPIDASLFFVCVLRPCRDFALKFF